MAFNPYFSAKEIKDIIISTLALGFIFSIGEGFSIAYALAITAIVGLSFIPHELAHKFVAIKYKCFARYEMWKDGLLFALLMAVVTGGRFVFAAPGAVVIYTMYRNRYGFHHVKLSSRQNAVISMAGPGTNILIALLFLFVLGGASPAAATIIARINLFLATFNLLPIPPLDGSKIIWWNIPAWLALFGLAGGLLYLL